MTSPRSRALRFATTLPPASLPMRWGQAIHRKWQEAGHASTLVSYPDGGHGFGMRERGTSTDGWIEAFCRWARVAVGDGAETSASTTNGE